MECKLAVVFVLHAAEITLGDAVEHAHSVQNLVSRLAKHCVSGDRVREFLSPAAKSQLSKWTGNADGAASVRALNALMAELT